MPFLRRLPTGGGFAGVLLPDLAIPAIVDEAGEFIFVERLNMHVIEAGGGIAEVGAGHFFNSSPAFISVGRRVILQQLQVI